MLFITGHLFSQETKNIEGITLRAKAVKYKSKKENPAYAIMQKVWEHKRKNGLENYKNYQYEEYEKIEFDLTNIDSTFMKKKIFNKLDFIFKYTDSTANGKLALPMFLNESISKTIGQNQPSRKEKKTILANKSSGFEDNAIINITAKDLYKNINIYDNTLNYFNIGFPSPVSTEGFSNYDYNLIDEKSFNGESCFHIKYFPKRAETLAFQGDLYISKEKYAVVKATLRSTKKMNVNFVNGIFTELEYEAPDDETFLPKKNSTELNLSIFTKSKNEKGIIGKRTVSYRNYLFDQNIDEEIFDQKSPPVDLSKLQKDDLFWQKERKDSLSKTEAGVYAMIEELEKTPKFNRIVKFSQMLGSGYWNVGNAIDIGDLFSTFGFNDVEGTRIRAGARTFFSQNDTWRIQGYSAYGFKDHQFKYGAEAKVMFNKTNRFMVGVGTRRDIMQLGVQLTTDDGIMSRSFASSSLFSRGSNASLSSINQTNIFTSIEPWKNFQIRLDGTTQSIKSANPDKFNLDFYYNGDLRHTTLDSHLTLSLITRPGALFAETGVDRYEHSSLAPTFVLKYTKGLEGVFNADYNYSKLQFLYYQPILLGSWGKTLLNIEAGKNFNPVPLSIQNVIPGNQSYSLVPNTFSQLNYYEFVADAYSMMSLEQHFNGKILSYFPLIKKLKLREVAFFRSAYGTLSDASKNINVEGYKYSAPSEHIYYEYGFGIENIGFGNLRLLRVDFNWRGNYLDRPNISKYGIKAGFQFNF